MQRRQFLAAGSLSLITTIGCSSRQHAAVLSDDQSDMVASHQAGVETWKPLINESVAKLLGRQHQEIQQVALEGNPTGRKAICFVGVENASSEELGDFREQIYEQIDTQISQSGMFMPISRRYFDAGLQEARLHPDMLFVPEHQQTFQAVMQTLGHPFDYLLFAKVTSGTTVQNQKSQKNYVLTLELVNIQTGGYDKESAEIRKGYYKTRLGRALHQ